MIKKLAVVIVLVTIASLSLAGCIRIIDRKNNDTEQHYPTLTKEASSPNAMVIITYPKSVYPLKVSSSDGDRWRWSWKLQFTEVNGTAVTLNGMNHFISSAGVAYGALGTGSGILQRNSGWKRGISVPKLDGSPDQLAAIREISFRVLGYRPIWPTPIYA